MFHDSTDTGAVFNRHMCAIGDVTCDWLSGGGRGGGGGGRRRELRVNRSDNEDSGEYKAREIFCLNLNELQDTLLNRRDLP